MRPIGNHASNPWNNVLSSLRQSPKTEAVVQLQKLAKEAHELHKPSQIMTRVLKRFGITPTRTLALSKIYKKYVALEKSLTPGQQVEFLTAFDNTVVHSRQTPELKHIHNQIIRKPLVTTHDLGKMSEREAWNHMMGKSKGHWILFTDTHSHEKKVAYNDGVARLVITQVERVPADIHDIGKWVEQRIIQKRKRE